MKEIDWTTIEQGTPIYAKKGYKFLGTFLCTAMHDGFIWYHEAFKDTAVMASVGYLCCEEQTILKKGR